MYLVVGANGFLGSYILRSILEQTEEKVVATARSTDNLSSTARIHWQSCEVSDSASVDRLCETVHSEKDVKVIYLAACHNPDEVEAHPQKSWDINVTCLSGFINKFHFSSKFFYASTDCVYGNSCDGYRFKEADALNPLNLYGRNKCAAEAIAVHYGYNVVRFPFLIGPSLVKQKKHFYDVIAESISSGVPIPMFIDSFRSSIDFKQAGELFVQIVEMNAEQSKVPAILNVCGDHAVSKYEIGIKIAESLGADKRLIVPASIRQNHIFKTERAMSTLMDNARLKQLLNLDKLEIRI